MRVNDRKVSPEDLHLLPGESLRDRPFIEWDQDVASDDVCTAYWNAAENRVLWAEGFRSRETISQPGVGRTIEELIKEAEKPPGEDSGAPLPQSLN